MQRDEVLRLLQQVAQGQLGAEEAKAQVEAATFAEVEADGQTVARMDHQRSQRLGFPEVVYAEGKTVQQLQQIIPAHLKHHESLLLTRLEAEKHQAVKAAILANADQAVLHTSIHAALKSSHYHPTARTWRFGAVLNPAPSEAPPVVGVICAGTSDLPVAEEACETLRAMQLPVDLITDVGVAGLHRLTAQQSRISRLKALVVVAGMEGALPSVIGGLFPMPIIAVPTSVGYGASLGGLSALLGMLNSCAPGVTVVNIDNGFGAAYAAARILKQQP